MNEADKQRFTSLISENKIQLVIDELKEIEWNKSKQKQIISIANQYKRLEDRKNSGTLSQDREDLLNNKITNRLFNFINNLRDDEDDLSFEESNSSFVLSIYAKYILTGLVIFIILFLIFRYGFQSQSLQLTVFVKDHKGNVVIENRGRLNIPLGNRSLNEIIGDNGRVNFPDIPIEYKGDSVQIGLEAEGWKVAEPGKKYVFDGKPIHLIVIKDNSLGTIKGIVKSRDGQELINSARIIINNDTTIYTDSIGIFNVILPERMQVKEEGTPYFLTISKSGFKTKTEYYYPKSSEAEIRLEYLKE